MATPIIDDARLIRLGAAPGVLPNIPTLVRDDHRAAASDLVVGVVGSRYLVPDPWAADMAICRLVADIATFSLLDYRGFDPETEKSVRARYSEAMELLEKIEHGRFNVRLSALRRAKLGAQTTAEESSWINWRAGGYMRRGWL